ncbi:MAG TPA: tRNA lysidine(34) synthetase TilS, partial [Gemmatimonadales bacterium]|nr:tRNA lysidine(34) synthetase TilS [Gemmatimonadales bacterium]
MTALPTRFRAHLDRAGLFPEPGTAVVAVSGGPDSVALLDLLAGVAPERGLRLLVAHVDHGIRSESRKVAQAVGRLARQYGLPFELGELRLGAGASETVARRARYDWLRWVQGRHGARYLVTAHHRDDQAETVLLRLLRGSAPAGLAGIPARGRQGLVRPLLPFTRAELRAHVEHRGLPVEDDPANRDPRHLRSWVRHRLLPVLAERLGPGVGRDLARVAREAARDRRAWDRVLELLPELAFRIGPDGFTVARPVLAGYDDAVAVAVLRAAARRVGLVLGPRRARRVAALARAASGRRIELGSGWVAETVFDRLAVSRDVG